LVDPSFNPKVKKNKAKLLEMLDNQYPIFYNLILSESRSFYSKCILHIDWAL